MKKSDDQPRALETRLIRAPAPDKDAAAHSQPLYLTSSFTFASAAEAAARFGGGEAGYVYSRFSNPNADALAARLAALENGESALTTASGMAAILATALGVCRAGSRVVCSAHVFGATLQLCERFLRKFGVKVDYAYSPKIAEWEKLLARPAALVLLETPSNPTLEIFDLRKIAALAKKAGAVFAVDNCFCPVGQNPLDHGADLVIHSATKYLDGQGRVLGGGIVGGRDFLRDTIYPFLRAAGPSISPFNAWVVAAGIETLPARFRVHCAQAQKIARWLEKQKGARRVLHAGLPSHPAHKLAMRQQGGLGGAIVSFAVDGGQAGAWRFLDALQMVSRTANFGDIKSTATHPATTTHSRVDAKTRARLGIGDDLLRLSVGLEAEADIRADLRRGLAAL